jgi:hypothetical protein
VVHGWKFFRNGVLALTRAQPSNWQWTPDSGSMNSEVSDDSNQLFGGVNDHKNFSLMRYGLGTGNKRPDLDLWCEHSHD